MKRNFLIVLNVFILLFFCSCNETEELMPPSLNLSESEISFDADGGSESFTITSNVSWNITGGKSWLTVAPNVGDGNKVVVVSVEENTALQDRECRIIVKTDDGTIKQSLNIIQEATFSTLMVDVDEITLSATAGSSRSFNIKSNDKWTITGCPDWLQLSTSSASGDVTVTMDVLTTNYSASDRVATLKIMTSSKTHEVNVIQKAAWLSNCVAKPVELTILYDCAGFVWDFVGEVAYYYYGVIEKELADRMTPMEIIEAIIDDGERDTPGDNYISSVNNLYSLTEYILYAVAYNGDGVQGDLYSVPFTTSSYINQPYAEIKNVTFTSNYWYWDTEIGPFASSYYMWTSESDYYSVSDGIIAYIINRDIKNSPESFPKIVQNGSWTLARTGDMIQIITWGLTVDGELGGFIERYRGHLISSSLAEPLVKDDQITSISEEDYKKLVDSIVRIY